MRADQPIHGGALVELYSDAAKRCSEAINNHLHVHGMNAIGKWVAIKLHDGSSDGVMYDTRADAIRHQIHEQLCCYVKIPPAGMPVGDAEGYMAFVRKAYDGGFRLIDPDDERQLVMPYTLEDFRSALRGGN